MFFNQTDFAYRHLDKIALHAKTDKSSRKHDYTRIYAKLFAPLRKRKIRFLEIGVQFGYSIHLWERYFRKGDLYFFDIDLSYLIYQPKRAHLYQVDQGSREQLHKVLAQIGTEFDIIIDDGGHRMDQQQISFETLFPHVRPGGLYIIEDTHTSYLQEYQFENTRPTIEYLKKEIDQFHMREASDIDSITFYPKLVVIRKKPLCTAE